MQNVTAICPKLFHSLPCCGHIFQVICEILMWTHVHCFHLSWQGLFFFACWHYVTWRMKVQKGSTFY